MEALVFDVQRFSLHDGPGIRTTVFFKGCPLRCLWCQNPESQSNRPQIAYYSERCVSCLECRKACPEGAIRTDPERRVDFGRCRACGACAKACPAGALRLVGVSRKPESLLEEVLHDIDFYDDSGGGVTLSGGEPLARADFLQAFLPGLASRGVHVLLETCGAATGKALAGVMPHVREVYFDLKCMDSATHRKLTGADNKQILKNFKKIAAVPVPVRARMPVVPGLNDGEENLLATARFLRETGVPEIRLLAYHRLGESKLSRIRTEARPLGIEPDPGSPARAAEILEKAGVSAILPGKP